MSVNDIYHVLSKLNISGQETRADATVEDLSPGNDQQDGPTYMRFLRNEWPLTQDTRDMTVPDDETQNIPIVRATTEIKTSNTNLNRFKGRSYIFLLRTFALVLKIAASRPPSFTEAFKAINLTEIQLAEEFTIKVSIVYTKRELDAGKLKSLGALENSRGKICVKS